MASEERHVALFYKQHESDKEYHVHLVKQGSGYVVRIEYGRRGSSLTSSQKTPVPVDLDAADKIFTAQVHSKRLKGYTEGAGKAPYVGGDKEGKITGVLPQLLNPIDEDTLAELLKDDNFCMQEKKDGKRILIRKQGSLVEAINRKGLLVGFPEGIQQACQTITEDFLLDGELIGETIWLFDILEYAGTSLRDKPYSERYKTLSKECIHLDSSESAIQLVATAFTTSTKSKVFKVLEEKGVEGVVFKRVDSPYTPGRPASKGNQLKYKFIETCTCEVEGPVEGKRSVFISVQDGSNKVNVGKVTVLPNFEVPEKGALIEVKYLYRHIHGALYQPVFIGLRTDLDNPDQVSTLKIKEGIDEIDDEA